MTAGRFIVTPTTETHTGRVLEHVPAAHLLPAARTLKARLESYIEPAHCADYCWVKGRREEDAWAIVDEHPDWQFLDIMHFFPSVPHRRLWKVLNRLDAELTFDVMVFFFKLGIDLRVTDAGLPEGCPFSPALANLYLAAFDRRWLPRGLVRVGDNIATTRREAVRSDLLQIGLLGVPTSNFTGLRKAGPQEVGPVMTE